MKSEKKQSRSYLPSEHLSIMDALCLMIGVVVGVGIFRAPSVVASDVSNDFTFLMVWILGAFISLMGAFCYAEIVSSFPDSGGEYHFLNKAYGKTIGFLFAWARISVIQTGAIATVAFVVGDYASEIYPLGIYSSSIYAASAILFLTMINGIRVNRSKWLQNILTGTNMILMITLIIIGFFFDSQGGELQRAYSSQEAGDPIFGLAMIFVLLTFGGWNEAAYLSAEVKNVRKNMAKVLIIGVSIIAILYFLLNFAYLNTLGLEGIKNSDVVVTQMLRTATGDSMALLISIIVVIASLTTLNASIFTGARSHYALGRDFPIFQKMGQWNQMSQTPRNALWIQGMIAFLLIGLGAFTREGFSTMVEYTAPVFWIFFLFSGISLFILRRKEPERKRPFKVPFYPIVPILFCLSCLYMVYASLAYTEVGAFVGLGVLLVGLPVLYLSKRIQF